MNPSNDAFNYLCVMQKTWYGNNFRLGVLGGGQLGRMMIQEAINYNIHVHCLDPDSNAPCRDISHSFTHGSLTDFDTVYEFGKDKHVITVEIEHVNIEALERLESEGIRVFPQPHILKMVQDKGVQKSFYRDHQIPTPDFYLVENRAEIEQYQSEFPFMQKMRKGGYDGKGVTALKTAADLETAFDVPSVLEKFVDFDKELSVIVARNEKGETKAYPTVECEFSPEANLVEFLFAPAEISADVEERAKKLAIEIIEKLEMVGILAVELFLTKSGEILVNEIAPRPHNSGHQTIECNVTSQFEQHLRSILNLPLGSTRIIQPGVMINLLGEKGFEGDAVYRDLEKAMAMEGVHVHLYGKAKTKPFRKMGHVTIVAEELATAKKTGRSILNLIRVEA
ncbi:MAG: 5-(carboxyamino)imidazole ribonucleotide synthase [Crocinitomicaceae bacterium]|nr:5-(carboxyamino)imidazole ribonucleotide synthase [Crocinitomicaceae bacterium]